MAEGQPINRLTEINWHECLELLRTERVGRLVVIVDGRPDIFPVNFSLDATDSVIMRTGVGTKLKAAVNHDVSFEVDHFDADQHAGWSIVIHGVAHQTSYIVEGEHPVASWLDDTPHMLRIARTSMTGRRVNPESRV
jgi:nitroimidazol reductase NimA-like FMN-containing flavoprotein (pyridoxamine 5'-phosphate oxidase superfamily)